MILPATNLQSIPNTHNPSCTRAPTACSNSGLRDEGSRLCFFLQTQHHTKYDDEAGHREEKGQLGEPGDRSRR